MFLCNCSLGFSQPRVMKVYDIYGRRCCFHISSSANWTTQLCRLSPVDAHTVALEPVIGN